MTTEKLIVPLYDYNRWRLVIPKYIRNKLKIENGNFVEITVKKWEVDPVVTPKQKES